MSDPVFELTRAFDAPLALVWEMYAKEEHLRHWWGPKGFTWISGTLDFRPGGSFLYGMRAPTGQEMWGRFDYRAIEPLKRLAFTTSFSNPEGEVVRAPFAASFPLRVLNDISFSEADGRTTYVENGRPTRGKWSVDEGRFSSFWPPSYRASYELRWIVEDGAIVGLRFTETGRGSKFEGRYRV